MIAARVNDNYKEITKVFAGGDVQAEVIKVWSTDADTWVYEATDEISGALPLTFHADGSVLVDYRLYGNTGGVGDRTENLFNAEIVQGGFVYASGAEANANNRIRSTLMGSKLPAGTYTLSSTGMTYVGVYSYDDNGFASAQSFRDFATIPYTFTITEPVYVRFVWRNASNTSIVPDNISNVMLTEGSTAPASFVPYGYKLDMVSKTDNLLSMDDVLTGYWGNSTTGWVITDSSTIPSTANYRSTKTAVSAGTYAFSFSKPVTVVRIKIGTTWVYDGNTPAPEYQNITSLTITANTDTDIGISARNAESVETPWGDITIELAKSTTTPIYIGDDPLEKINTYSDYVDYEPQKVVRAIKKYVLTGNENWEEITGAYASRTYFRWIFEAINYCVRHVCTSSHFTQATITTATTTAGFDVFDSTSVNGEVLAIRPTNVQSTTLADFKAWLAEQYAAGTPVTVWCALTVAEEVDPPVPLPALPTCEGETVIDYDGTPAPSSVYAKYKKGW